MIPSDLPEDTAPPLREGRYRLLSELGAGGMATVYRAYDALLDVFRAVKVLDPQYAKERRLRDRFLNEARTMARLHHRNIVTVHDVGTDGERVYMVMELLGGGSLMERVAMQGALPPALAVRTVIDVLSGLEEAHQLKIVHRDIKPHNILLSSDGTPKLTDFGIAQFGDSEMALTRTGAVMGTWAYMAPEQRTNAKAVDARSDVYAMGGTLFAILTSEEPFDLYVQETHARRFQGVPEALATVIQHASRYAAEDRYVSAAAFRAALLEILPALPPDPAETPPLALPEAELRELARLRATSRVDNNAQGTFDDSEVRIAAARGDGAATAPNVAVPLGTLLPQAETSPGPTRDNQALAPTAPAAPPRIAQPGRRFEGTGLLVSVLVGIAGGAVAIAAAALVWERGDGKRDGPSTSAIVAGLFAPVYGPEAPVDLGDSGDSGSESSPNAKGGGSSGSRANGAAVGADPRLTLEVSCATHAGEPVWVDNVELGPSPVTVRVHPGGHQFAVPKAGVRSLRDVQQGGRVELCEVAVAAPAENGAAPADPPVAVSDKPAPAVLPPAAGQGQICVYRPSGAISTTLPIWLYVDDLEAGSLKNAKHACLPIPPGRHKVLAAAPGVREATPALAVGGSVSVPIESGDTRFVRLDVADNGGRTQVTLTGEPQFVAGKTKEMRLGR